MCQRIINASFTMPPGFQLRATGGALQQERLHQEKAPAPPGGPIRRIVIRRQRQRLQAPARYIIRSPAESKTSFESRRQQRFDCHLPTNWTTRNLRTLQKRENCVFDKASNQQTLSTVLGTVCHSATSAAYVSRETSARRFNRIRPAVFVGAPDGHPNATDARLLG
ncbi:hypothetical protein L596_024422 [Steinernema carpocapsae]|uniref:Uncharacterized protein n=1 Tax=Steinernema carpocapsae TaxID=34508 RepID=A0A4U5MHF3_STECR|nr:hypothetical protein L596_024422 [Steinernema carpocapsae]